MQTPKLSSTQWAWTKDPIAFVRRIEMKAETLWEDGYTVEVTDKPGVFQVNTGNRDCYFVDHVAQTCTCPFATKAEIPGCRCKHLVGLAQLIDNQLGFYYSHEAVNMKAGRTNRAREWRSLWFQLVGHWAQAKDMVEATLMEMDVETYRKWVASSQRDQWELEVEVATKREQFAAA